MHLGTNTIRLNDGRLAAFLHVLCHPKHNNYKSLLYILEAELPHRVLGISDKPLKLSSASAMLFTTSLLRVNDNDVLVGYGVGDNTAHIDIISMDTLLAGVIATPVSIEASAHFN